jgi:FdhD protein
VNTRARVTRWESGRVTRTADELAAEEPLEIRIDTQPLVVTMRTPGHDEELAAGFLVSEGILRTRDDLVGIQRNPRNRHGNSLDVFLSPKLSVNLQRLRQRVFTTSSCGLCGRESLASIRRHFPRITSRLQIDATLLAALPDRLRAAQPAFDRTGGLHAAAIFAKDGELLFAREDIGRHNAVDKVIGAGLFAGLLPFSDRILTVSGRASFEILQKVLAAQVPIICAVSAPSSLAVEFARQNGQTLIGFARGNRMNIYTHARRVLA